MKTFYLTGTGNSLQIARGVGSGGELVSIPRFLREHRGGAERIVVEDDVIGLVFPTYWCALPQIVVEFLQRTRLEADYLFAIATRGNATATLKSHLLQVARQNGHVISYYSHQNMPDNYLPLFDMAKEKLRYDEDALTKSMAAMAADIGARKHNTGGIAGLTFLRPFLTRFADMKMADFSQRFIVSESCDGCETCARVCSAQIIKLSNNNPVFHGVCNGCLACAHNCPNTAILMRKEKSTERYRNPTVTLSDLIAANS